jgi:hypothetical protein
LQDNFEEAKDFRNDVIDRIDVLFGLGCNYAYHCPDKYEDAENLFNEILDIGTCAEGPQDYYQYRVYLAYGGLALLSSNQGDLGRALRYQHLCLAAAI